MKIIQCLSEMMLEEVADAEKYAKKALKWKDNNRPLADTFHKLATDELGHMTYLHAEAVKIIEEYRKPTETLPPLCSPSTIISTKNRLSSPESSAAFWRSTRTPDFPRRIPHRQGACQRL